MANKVIEAVESFEDFVGNTVRVGDFVVYATVSGRSPVQKFAIVERIELVEPDIYSWRETTDEARVKARFVRVGVRELTNGRKFIRWDTYDWKTRENDPARQARVTYPMRQNIVLVRTAKQQELLDNPPVVIEPAPVGSAVDPDAPWWAGDSLDDAPDHVRKAQGSRYTYERHGEFGWNEVCDNTVIWDYHCGGCVPTREGPFTEIRGE
jgi:hypothetical protein